MATVTTSRGKLVIEFQYDPRIVSLVQTIDGREYDKKKKLWKAPLVQATNVVNTLGPVGFNFDDKCIEEYHRLNRLLWKSQRLKAGDFTPEEEASIDFLQLPFFAYQRICVGFMAAVGSGLVGDQPGLGKTLQSLGVTKLVKANKVLVFCPVSLKGSWAEEIQKWLAGSTVTVINGDKKTRAEQWQQDTTYYICNYHLLLRDLDFMKEIEWDVIVADEATILSNPKSKTCAALKKLKAKRKLALTGTPLNNTPEDVWSIMDWVQPGLLGTNYQFMQEYTSKDAYGGVGGYKNLNRLKEKLEPYMIRRLKVDVLDELPPKLFETIYVEFSREERRLYGTIQTAIASELIALGVKNPKYMKEARVKMTRLKQMTNSCELITGQEKSSKLDALKEILPFALAGGEKAIIFTQFREMALILMRELAEYNPLLIAGGVTQEDRDANRHAFNNNEVNQLLIMTSAGDMGLNLQRATSVVHYDLPWSVSKLEQREDRAHRHGQKKNVTIYKLLVRDSIDEYILNKLYDKKDVSETILGDKDAEEARSANIDTEDLDNLLS
jgi:SNF2 family DNA or RNA helicase